MPVPEHRSEVASRADFSIIRYAQCWEDADVLLQALDIQPGDVCFSVGSGGENTLSMLSRGPAQVLAVDLSTAQAACLELKAAGFRALPYDGLLELVGVRESARRGALYASARSLLSDSARAYWDTHQAMLEAGLLAAVIAHELGHVLGFQHEHQRWDRDRYVTIHYEHIKPGREHDYDWVPRKHWIVATTSYDYRSIMHYRTCWASSCEPECHDGDGTSPCAVIDPVGSDYDRVIGQWTDNGISAIDGEKLRRVYGTARLKDRKPATAAP